jgi:thiol-disulfide isomerase/thioredoxin
MNRRLLLGSAAAVAAGVGGAGFFLWQERLKAHQAERDHLIWNLEFGSPEGAGLALSKFKGRPLLLNFWATWCPPCLEEMPLLSEFHRSQGSQGWQVVGLAVDNEPAVKAYLKQTPADFPIGIAGFGGLDMAFDLGNDSRQLPFSVLFDRQGTVVQRKLGAFSAEDLAQLAADQKTP